MIGPRQALLRQLQLPQPFADVVPCREGQLALGRVLLQLAYEDAWDTVLTRTVLRTIGADYGLHYHPGGRVCSVGDLVGSDGLLKASVQHLLTR